MRLSRQFTEHVGLVTPRLRAVFDKMDAEGYTFTMAMFGEVAFSIMEKEQGSRSCEAVREMVPRLRGGRSRNRRSRCKGNI